MHIRFLIIILSISYSVSFAQTSRDNTTKGVNKKEIDRGATYGVESSKAKKKKVKYSISKDFDRKVEEYEERMKANAKKNEKMAREMQKPQYSDPTYFGHKKKPKKRPPGKKKFCKECQMFH